MVDSGQPAAESPANGPAEVDGQPVERKGPRTSISVGVERNGRLVGGAERVAEEREDKYAAAKGVKIGYELENKQKSATEKQTHQLNVVEPEPVGEPLAEKRTHECLRPENGHDNARVGDGVAQMLA